MIDPATLKQLEALKLAARPLLICDVDEVILHLVAPFEQLLTERGMGLEKKATRLLGNVYHLSDGRKASQDDIWSTLNLLFEQQASRQRMVEGAASVLAALFDDFDIVILTNLPHDYGDTRRLYLSEIRIPYPLITNSGAKGPPVKWLSERCTQKTVFIDDTSHHLESVDEHSPTTSLIHFMADDEFREITKLPNSVLLSSGDWQETGNTVRAVLTG